MPIRTEEKPIPPHTLKLEKVKILKQEADSVRNLEVLNQPIIWSILWLICFIILGRIYIWWKNKLLKAPGEELTHQSGVVFT